VNHKKAYERLILRPLLHLPENAILMPIIQLAQPSTAGRTPGIFGNLALACCWLRVVFDMMRFTCFCP